MLQVHDVSLKIGDAGDELLLLHEISARFPRRHLAAVLGPSGCGKSTLLKVIAGLREHTSGELSWDGRDLAAHDMDPHEIGYVPQFGIAYELLTVWESVEAALRLRIAGLDLEERHQRVEQTLQDVGLEEIAERRVQRLSGGQRRRLALALEIISSPHLLLCDEVTSGLDPKSEDEVIDLLRTLSRSSDRIVLSVTHSLRHLALHDSVLVLYHGHVAYHGAPATLLHYFNVEHADELFPRLASRSGEEWHRSWVKHRAAYYDAAGLGAFEVAEPTMGGRADSSVEDDAAKEGGESNREAHEPSEAERVTGALEQGTVGSEPGAAFAPTPSAVTQFFVLLARRWRLFVRDRGALALQLALLLGFPCLVVVFALDGLPQLQSLSDSSSGNLLQQIRGEISARAEFIRAGSLVSGLIMFQVILLALMGANNAAREIAGERLIFEKEKFAGLSPLAYVLSKAAFLGLLVLGQSIWMAFFVDMIVRFPGDLLTQIILLTLVNGALTAASLAVSSLMKTAEQASLVSVYLVGFQLPLSGAVLALPGAVSFITRPFIAAFWSWSGFIQTLRETRLYDAVQLVSQTPLAATPLCVWVLASHIVLGLIVAYTGCKSSRWE